MSKQDNLESEKKDTAKPHNDTKDKAGFGAKSKLAPSEDIYNDTQPIFISLVKIKKLSEYNPWKSYGEHLCYDVKYIHHKKLEYDGGEELGAKNGGEVYTCARRLGVGWANTPQCRDLATYLMIDRGWTL